jgi:uncharacterized protein YdeI (YjbR/CyaY-like superfamily)
MGTRDKRIDAYIAKSAPFARPILERLREAVHEGCPEVAETLKWRMPSFEHKGLLAGMGAFKAHCIFGFWKHELVLAEAGKELDPKWKEAMGSFGRLTDLADLPPKRELVRLVKIAKRLNDEGVKPVRAKHARPALPVPPVLAAALARNKKAKAHFEAFSPSKQREYSEWISTAKTDETRSKRLATAIEWIAEGKARHWRYERC